MRVQKRDDKDRKSITLILRSEKDVEGLLQYPNLEELNLRTPIRNVDFSALKELTKLKTLKVNSRSYGKKLSSKNFGFLLSSIPNLESLTLHTKPATNDTIRNISTLKGLKYLRLNIGKTPSTDLSPLSNCVNLIKLALESSGQRQESPDLGFLQSLLDLTHLAFKHIRPLNLDSLSSCRKLLELDLRNNELEHVSLDSLSSCRLLEQLDMSVNRFSEMDLSPLSSCTELNQINFRYNRIREIDLAPLSTCHKLKRLNLSENRLVEVDLSPLRDVDLEHLNLGRNQLNTINLSPLSRCYNLSSLNLGENRLKEIDLSPLHECKILRTLRLQRNKLKEINLSPLAGCLLGTLDLKKNPLTEIDLTPISSTIWVDMPLKGSRGVKTGEKVRGGSMWRARIHPQSVDEIRWPRACIGCGKIEGPLEGSSFSWKSVERSVENVDDFQRILYVGVGKNIIGKLYLNPNLFGGIGFLSTEWSEVITNFHISRSLDICPNCKTKSAPSEFVDIGVHFDWKNKQTLFTITFSSKEYAKLFKRKNRCMKPTP